MASLDHFSVYTSRWFAQAIGTPTAVQDEAWPAIASGRHTLVSAPTGTGKTLASFLVFIDKLKAQARAGNLPQELHLIYVSPLKSLAGDIRENLRRPLLGIAREERAAEVQPSGLPTDLTVAIRTGDTPQIERRRMIKTRPHILITTPESLYLMLTSLTGQSILCTARWIILDELHALIDTKRGAHLMLSLARLDRLCPQPLQRIGLSATIQPLSRAAAYLSPDPVAIAAPLMQKSIELVVTSTRSYQKKATAKREGIWQDLAHTVYDLCTGVNSVIAFVEGRAYAEKLAFYVNQVGGEGFARTHHGSLSKEQRAEVENDLRGGSLRLLCATSSMELGIDVGAIDQVFQIGCPRSISSTLQRLGRAGHNPGRVSVMHIFPRAPAEALFSGLTAEVVRQGGVEPCKPPRLCLDVLAQHLVSMATGEGYTLDDVMHVLSRAYPFQDVTREDVHDVLCMLAGDYEHKRDIPVRPRLLYDRIHEQVHGDPYSRMLATSAGGTIPDKGLYTVRTPDGIKLGELDEEYVFEARVGDKFLLGSFAWQISRVQQDAVIVVPSTTSGARPPFWKGEIKGRSLQTGLAFGELFRKLGDAHDADTLLPALSSLGLDEDSAESVKALINRQMTATGILADDRTILVEHFCDETGKHQLMVHSVFGRPVNEPLAILTTELAKQLTNTAISYVDDDDGFLLFPYGDFEMPEGLLQHISVPAAQAILMAVLPTTLLFNMAFRYNAARALMMGVRQAGRQPLWVQRLRGAEMLDSLKGQDHHPLIRETKRECLEDYWDLPGVEQVLAQIRQGTIKVREIFLDAPSPLSLTLRQQVEAAMMYDYAPTTPGIRAAAEDALKQAQMIEPAPEQLSRTTERVRLPEHEEALHALLMIEGDLVAGEIDVPIGWLERLVRQGRVMYIEPGLWIAAEHEPDYILALQDGDLEERMHLVRRLLRYRGAQSVETVAERYLWSEEQALGIFAALVQRDSAVENNGLYYHAELYDRARQETLKSRRRQVVTLPSDRYASLLASRVSQTAPQSEKLEAALKALSGLAFPVNLWESTLLPARVGGYRPELLDALLAQGNLYWRLDAQTGLSFHPYEDIDWDADMTGAAISLEGDPRIIYDALLKRGASFMHRLTDLLDGKSPYDVLMQLAEKSLVCADSFVPIRQWLNKEMLDRAPVKQRARARAMIQSSGRWEVARPLIARSLEQQLDRAFDRYRIICRETAQNLNWPGILEILRVWEFTGRARRGYFIEGMSGIQFIREQDYAATMLALEQPQNQIIWLPAVDPAQPWGKSLSHRPGKSFMNVPGTAVALQAGTPVAVFERQGKSLRVLDESVLEDTLLAFAYQFAERRIFSTQNRVSVKHYPSVAVAALTRSGFVSEVQDYVLYRRHS